MSNMALLRIAGSNKRDCLLMMSIHLLLYFGEHFLSLCFGLSFQTLKCLKNIFIRYLYFQYDGRVGHKCDTDPTENMTYMTPQKLLKLYHIRHVDGQKHEIVNKNLFFKNQYM